ncbi:MAG: hypothetical protein JWQ48_2447 [Conexibacter sp.]|nr:hypothetical protein [Conexibacter sp.]
MTRESRASAPTGTTSTAGLEIRGAGSGLLDDPLLLNARGAGPDETLLWRARLRDDDGRVWQTSAARADDLAGGWVPAKASSGPLAALGSLRPASIEVRVESSDGRAATRTIARLLLGEGVRVRRWRDLAATLYLPAQAAPTATLLIDATAGPQPTAVAALAAPLLASRGVLVVAVAPGRDGAPPAATLAAARERLAAVPAAAAAGRLTELAARDPVADAVDAAAPPDVPAAAVVLPPGIGARDAGGAAGAAARAGAWDALLLELGGSPRARR